MTCSGFKPTRFKIKNVSTFLRQELDGPRGVDFFGLCARELVKPGDVDVRVVALFVQDHHHHRPFRPLAALRPAPTAQTCQQHQPGYHAGHQPYTATSCTFFRFIVLTCCQRGIKTSLLWFGHGASGVSGAHGTIEFALSCFTPL